MTTHSKLVAALLSLAVAGCGGGGGTSSAPSPVAEAPSPSPAPSPPPAPSPAPAGFSVVSTTPADGATSVARTSPISFTLNDAPSANTLPATQSDSILLATPEGVNLLTGVTVSSDTVSIANSGLALAGNTTYNVKLGSSIGSTAGKTLGSPFSWSFTTANETWSLPGTNIYQLTSPNSLFLAIATDPTGNVFAAVVDDDSVSAQMYSATTNSWGTAASTIFSSPFGAVGSLNLTTTDAEPIATWVGYQGATNLAIYLSTFQLTGPGVGSWSAPSITPIEPPGSGTTFLAIPLDISQVSSGHVLTLAARINAMPPDVTGIYIAQYDELAQTWSPHKIFIAQGISLPYNASVATAADNNGNVTVAYINNGHLLVSTKSSTSQTWGELQQVDKLTTGSINSIALGAGVGGTTLSWAQTSGSGEPTIEVSQLGSDLSTWSTPLQLDDGSSPTGTTTPSIAVDNAGFVDIAYIQSNTSNTVAPTDGAFLVRFNPTTAAWSSPIRISAVGVGVNAARAALAVDNAGNVELLYQVGDGIAAASYYVSAGTVTDPGLIDNPNGAPSGVAAMPYLVFGPDNVATGVWLNHETAGAFIRADRKQ